MERDHGIPDASTVHNLSVGLIFPNWQRQNVNVASAEDVDLKSAFILHNEILRRLFRAELVPNPIEINRIPHGLRWALPVLWYLRRPGVANLIVACPSIKTSRFMTECKAPICYVRTNHTIIRFLIQFCDHSCQQWSDWRKRTVNCKKITQIINNCSVEITYVLTSASLNSVYQADSDRTYLSLRLLFIVVGR